MASAKTPSNSGRPGDARAGEPVRLMSDELRARIYLRGRELYRDLPWRHTQDPYQIWVSEAMLQQTQVSRVDGRWQSWLVRFPSVVALAQASSADVLDEWQGLGYNRRALALWRAAQQMVELHGGEVPREARELVALPGIGPATAAGIRAFAFDAPGVYLETNVRSVFLHELYPGEEGVPDRALVPAVEAACPAAVANVAGCDVPMTPRSWYYALLDYGAYLKQTLPNPSRRSSGHTRQSKFEGSHRQKRAEVVRMLLAARTSEPGGLTVADVSRGLTEVELAAGREAIDEAHARVILDELVSEGFCRTAGDLWLA